MEKDTKNQTYLLHALPPAHGIPQIQEVDIKEIGAGNFVSVVGAKILDNNQVAVYLYDNKLHQTKKAIFDCETKEKVKENQITPHCTLCMKKKVHIMKAIVHGEYLITCEACNDENCQKEYASNALDKRHKQVVVARKRAEISKYHVILPWDYYSPVKIEANEAAVLLYLEEKKELILHHWNEILEDRIVVAKPKKAHHQPVQKSGYKCFFLIGDDYGYLTENNEVKMPGMPDLQLPGKKTHLYYSIAKTSTSRCVAAVMSAGKETSDLVLLSETGQEISRLEGKVYGWRDYNSQGYDSGSSEPAFSNVRLIAQNVLVVFCLNTLIHVVHVDKDSLTMMKEGLEIACSESTSLSILDWDCDKRRFVARWNSQDRFFLVSIKLN